MTGKDDLKEKIKRWLDEQGYPLEMRIASTLQRRGLRVVQSEYFIDPESGEARELDIVAYLQQEISSTLFRISLLIECKRSTDKPWLLFTSEEVKLADPARIAQRAANSLGRHFLSEICRQKEVQDILLFALPKRPSYGVTQALTSGKDVCYSAVTSVSKATLATVAELDEKKEKEKKGLGFRLYRENICSIVLPVIVVDGRLFEVFLDNDGELVVNETEEGTLLWRNPIVGNPHTIVNIVSSSAFDRFADVALTSMKTLVALSGEQLSDSLKKAIERENRPPITLL
jgi:hypothetical protein